MTPFLFIINKMKKKKIVIIGVSALVGAIALATAIPFTILGIRTASIDNEYSYLIDDPNYYERAAVGFALKKQDISCGYATIEMLSEYYGDKVTEIELGKRNNGAITTQSSNGFLKEVNKTIPTQTFVKRSYLKNDELLKEIYASLKKENPVAIEWAAEYEGEWTLHFSVVTAIDFPCDDVTIYNPYGYTEDLSLKEFIDRTSFKAYEHMPLFLAFGFAYGAFEKNTIFYAQ